ncbi:phage tail protein, partial [Schinkia azotoformans]|nr:phage tail protein [Schinkia azotoformans]
MPRKVLIQIRRGLEKDIGTLAVGELGYCTDTQKLYVGTASGNVLLVAAQTVGDMLKSIYDTNNDGIVDRASQADAVAWSN